MSGRMVISMPKRKMRASDIAKEIEKVCPIYGIARDIEDGPITRIDYKPEATPAQKGLATKLIKRNGWNVKTDGEVETPYENLSNSEKIAYLEERLEALEDKINRGEV